MSHLCVSVFPVTIQPPDEEHPPEGAGAGSGEGPVPHGSVPLEPDVPLDLRADEVGEAIVQLHLAEMAVHARLLALVRRFGELEGFRADGAPSLEAWLTFALGVSRGTARAWARCATALGALPAIAEVAAEGRFSHDQLAPLCALATPTDDAELAHLALGWTPAELQGALAARRAADGEVTEDAHRTRFFATRSEPGALRLSGRLTTEAGATLLAALDTLVAEAAPTPEGEAPEPYGARLADALVALAACSLGETATPPPPTVVVHVDAEALAGEPEGYAEVGDGERIPVTTARRLACDCTWQLVVEDAEGQVVRLGRQARRAPRWLTRQLRRRDRGCRWPGCGRTRWLHAHHLVHWADGGPTDADNLAMLCEYHHRFVHEGDWTVTASGTGTVVFTAPDGRTLTSIPPPPSPLVRSRLFGQATPGGEDPGAPHGTGTAPNGTGQPGWKSAPRAHDPARGQPDAPSATTPGPGDGTGATGPPQRPSASDPPAHGPPPAA